MIKKKEKRTTWKTERERNEWKMKPEERVDSGSERPDTGVDTARWVSALSRYTWARTPSTKRTATDWNIRTGWAAWTSAVAVVRPSAGRDPPGWAWTSSCTRWSGIVPVWWARSCARSRCCAPTAPTAPDTPTPTPTSRYVYPWSIHSADSVGTGGVAAPVSNTRLNQPAGPLADFISAV